MDDSSQSPYANLYEEAGQKSPDQSSYPTEEICPLYIGLKRIDIRYTSEEPITTGGMKEIYRVYDSPTERHVALARPKANIPIEKYDAFLREAHITGRLEHPNIIKLFDMGIDAQERPFFTMEFKRGLSLRKILTNLKKGKSIGEWPREQRYSIFLRVCEAMAYAHSRHVLHLDLKPENIQVGTFGEVQICDWGLGEIERGTTEEHLSEALLDPDLYGDQLPAQAIGTPGYMAPEQNEHGSIKTAKSDIFALGCLLFELATLKEPTERKESLPDDPAIAAIVKKACAQNPKNRYKDVDTMREDVYRHVLGFSPAVEQAGFLRECRLFYSRNRLPCLMTFGFALLLVGTGGWFNAELTESYRKTTQALDITNIALGEAEKAKVRANVQQNEAEQARDEAETARIMATIQQSEAEQERKKAERILEKYLLEKENSSALLTSQSENTVSGSLLLLNFLIMDETITQSAIENSIKRIDFALSNNPPRTDRLWTLKAYAHFIIQDFEKSIEYYNIRRGTQSDLRKLAMQFAPLVGENGRLSADNFIRLIEALINSQKDRAPLMEKMVIYDSLYRTSAKERAQIVRTTIELANANWKDPIFNYSQEKKHLEISGENLRKLIRPKVPDEGSPYTSRSMLRFIEIRSLDISSQNFYELIHLDGLELLRLDIRGTTVTDLSPLTGMPSLRELVVEEEQFSEAQLEEVPSFVQIVQKERVAE